jgi:hypothetical protein
MKLYHIFLQTKHGVIRQFDINDEAYTEIFKELLDRARSLEEQDPEFAVLLEELYLAVVSGPLAGRKTSFESA